MSRNPGPPQLHLGTSAGLCCGLRGCIYCVSVGRLVLAAAGSFVDFEGCLFLDLNLLSPRYLSILWLVVAWSGHFPCLCLRALPMPTNREPFKIPVFTGWLGVSYSWLLGRLHLSQGISLANPIAAPPASRWALCSRFSEGPVGLGGLSYVCVFFVFSFFFPCLFHSKCPFGPLSSAVHRFDRLLGELR